jgi:hypothetical protein
MSSRDAATNPATGRLSGLFLVLALLASAACLGSCSEGSPEDGSNPNVRRTVPDCMRVIPFETRTNQPTKSSVAVVFGVEDCNGNPVPGLSATDFTLYEDGEPVSVAESNATILPRTAEIYVSLVMDNSPSVRTAGALDKAVSAATEFVDRVIAGSSAGEVKIAVLFFSKRLELKQDFTSNSQKLVSALNSLLTDTTGSNTTNLHGAVIDAIDRSRSHQDERLTVTRNGVLTLGQIVLFTDGSDQAALNSLSEATGAVNATKDDVITVALGGEVDPEALAQIGKSGSYVAGNPNELESVFAEAASRITALQSRVYVLGYCSPKLAGTHQLDIEVGKNAGKSGGISFDASAFNDPDALCSTSLFEHACDDKQCAGLLCGGCSNGSECSVDGKCRCGSGGPCSSDADSCVNGTCQCGIGRACSGDRPICDEGTCVFPECPEEASPCDGNCVYLKSDTANCGSCGHRCASGATCENSTCRCPTGEMDCGGTCLGTQKDTANCGSCGHRCASGATCEGGTCRCPTGEKECSGSCVDTQSDLSNCGACGKVCSMAGSSCQSGTCRCQGTLTECGAACVDTQTDSSNCGGCGEACSKAGSSCQSGTCRCPTGTTDCAFACIDVSADLANCGKCGQRCAAGATCDDGICKCPTGQMDCGGVCIDVYGDSNNCGACGSRCAEGASCQLGSCECPPGQTDCGGICVDTESDSANCGSCGNVCTVVGSTCLSGDCYCPSGEVDCDGICRDIRVDQNNCGGCGRVCATVGATCRSSQCLCPIGEMECDGICREVRVDPENCGNCGNVCTVVGSSCQSGQCKCPAGKTACDGVCIDTATDPENCGRCGHGCLGAPCTNSLCQPTVLASNEFNPVHLAIDDEYVFFANSSDTVKRVSKSGGSVLTLASGQRMIGGLAADGSDVFWSLTFDGQILKVPRSGGAPTVVADMQSAAYAYGLVIDATNLYWCDQESIVKVSKAGGTPEILAAGRVATAWHGLFSDRSAKPEDVAVGIWQSRVSADSMGAVGQRPGWRRGASGEVSQLG